MPAGKMAEVIWNCCSTASGNKGQKRYRFVSLTKTLSRFCCCGLSRYIYTAFCLCVAFVTEGLPGDVAAGLLATTSGMLSCNFSCILVGLNINGNCPAIQSDYITTCMCPAIHSDSPDSGEIAQVHVKKPRQPY